ncbi:MAG: GntR family transcriptional regulator [Anaerolineales bacterium]|nr:GntR family transcriptional regulator [Anaerolineales bacterium]
MPGSYKLGQVESTPSLKDKAYDIIKDAILTLKLEPGTPLVETDLAQDLGISKTPVRDALQELEREGFVTRILFKGTYVTEVTIRDLQEIFQLRAVLEGFASFLATNQFTDKEIDHLEAHLQAAEAALEKGDLNLCSENGKEIHDAIINKADNQRLTIIIRNLDDHLQRFRLLSDQIHGRLDTSVKEHREIIRAICNKDPLAAERAMRNHLFSVLDDLSTLE